jgi:hypothetical protein
MQQKSSHAVAINKLQVTVRVLRRNPQFIYGDSMAALLHGCTAHGARVRYKNKHREGRPSYNTAVVPAPGSSCHSLNHAE